MLDVGSRKLTAGFGVFDVGLLKLDVGGWMLGGGLEVRGWLLEVRAWSLDDGRGVLCVGLWVLGVRT